MGPRKPALYCSLAGIQLVYQNLEQPFGQLPAQCEAKASQALNGEAPHCSKSGAALLLAARVRKPASIGAVKCFEISL